MTGQVARCPDWPQPGMDPADDLMGCGSTNVQLDEADGWYDCGACGLTFAPAQAFGPPV